MRGQRKGNEVEERKNKLNEIQGRGKEEEGALIIAVFVSLMEQGSLGPTACVENQMMRNPKEASYNTILIIPSIKLRCFNSVLLFVPTTCFVPISGPSSCNIHASDNLSGNR